MLLRICLIVAILGAGAVVAVNFVMVKPVIETIITQRTDENTAKKDALGKLTKSQNDLAASRTALTNTTKTLATTKADLDKANSNAKTLETKNTDLTGKLTDAQAQRDKFQAEMAKWDQLHLTPEQVTLLQDNLKKVTQARDGKETENQLLLTKLHDTQDELGRIRGTNNVSENPPLPPGLRGQIVAVDPKYGFVILNIGEDKKLLVNGIMMIARDGRLIGKVQIARVDKTQSVANILPAWRHGDVMEGDEVID